MSSKQIEVIVRGACMVSESILLCRTKGHSNTYLPGGHVEFNEGVREALRREMLEELGVSVNVGCFIGIVEHAFEQRGEQHCEINLVFEMQSSDLDPLVIPEAKEEYIEFSWNRVDSLDAANLEPSSLISHLKEWLLSGKDNLVSNY